MIANPKDIEAFEGLMQCSFCGRQKSNTEDFITSEKNKTVFICLPCTAAAWSVVSNAIATGALIKNPDWKPAQPKEEKEEDDK